MIIINKYDYYNINKQTMMEKNLKQAGYNKNRRTLKQ